MCLNFCNFYQPQEFLLHNQNHTVTMWNQNCSPSLQSIAHPEHTLLSKIFFCAPEPYHTHPVLYSISQMQKETEIINLKANSIPCGSPLKTVH